MSLIVLSNVRKNFGAQQIFDGVSFRIERGDHVALVGSNGAGKSTILRIVAGLEEPDGGTVTLSRNLHVVYLPQDPNFEASDTLYEVMLDTYRETIEAQERLRTLEQEMARRQSDAALVEEY